jgi:hypothetical protein
VNKLSVRDFSEKYSVSEQCVYQFKRANPRLFIKDGKNLFIDERRFLKLLNFKSRVINEAQQNYFKIAEELTDNEQVRAMHRYYGNSKMSYYLFVKNYLFSSKKNESILSVKVGKLMWEYYRFSRHFLRKSKNNVK